MADRPQPTPVAMIIGTAIISVLTGYMLGMASSLGFLPNPFGTPEVVAGRKTKTSNYDDEEETSEEEIDDVLLDHAPNWANAEEADRRDGLRTPVKPAEEKVEKRVEKQDWENSKEECKLVLVVRTDLGMTKGIILPGVQLLFIS